MEKKPDQNSFKYLTSNIQINKHGLEDSPITLSYFKEAEQLSLKSKWQ